MSRASGASSSQTILGECGYCGDSIVAKKHKFLPLECFNCKGVYHVACLKGPKPQTLLGDQLFKFSCAYCSPLSQEICSRPYLHWVHITHLVLYNLMIGRKGPRGRMGSDMREYFRWNEDICGFMRTHWAKLMPERKRTQSWRSTVAGTLSVNCPAVFTSGQSMFGESGWWTLTSVVPPDPRTAITSSPPSLGKRSTPLTLSPSTPLSPRLKTFSALYSPPPAQPPAKRIKTRPIKSLDLSHMTERQEGVLLSALEGQGEAVARSSSAARLHRKLKVRRLQRRYGQPTFNLDATISSLYSNTVKYVIDSSKPYYEQVVPFKKASSRPTVAPPTGDHVTSGEAILKRVTVLGNALPSAHASLRHTLEGGAYSLDNITSPYTSRVLKPYIFRTNDLCPLRVRLNQEICSGYQIKSFDFVYLREHLLPAVNSFLSNNFWPVDVSEYLQYPDFTCVVLYGHMIIGCAFMTPDVKVNEAYISFLLVHTQFRGASIGKLMLYHLIQTCQGKDVTLHVSVDNPAMLLYNQFGFKAEKYCLDFYEHYYPGNHHLSKHAYFMRLKR